MKYEKWKTTTRCNQGGRGDEAGAGGGELPGLPDGGLNARFPSFSTIPAGKSARRFAEEPLDFSWALC